MQQRFIRRKQRPSRQSLPRWRHILLTLAPSLFLPCALVLLPTTAPLAETIATAQTAVQDPVDGEDFSGELPRIAAVEPDAAEATLEVQPGFKAQLVAHEPLVTDPVAMAFDEYARLFVVEMRDYSEQAEDHLGRVRMLTDTDGDGRYDQSTIYAEGLSWPTAIACYDGGVFVGAAPDVWYLKDADGNGVADEKKVVLTGFRRNNVQGLMNTLLWGLDNRIHGSTSSSGADLKLPNAADADVLALNGRDFALNPKTMQVYSETGGGQHGMSFDDWGRRFICSNSDHLQLVMYEDRYAARNPFLTGMSPRISIAADGGQAEVYRMSEVEPWRVVRTRLRVQGAVPGPIEGGGRASGYFTSATGVTIIRGNAMGASKGMAVIGDVGSNLVHRKVLEPDGVGLIGKRVDDKSEFVASRDIWFRPAQYANGPDGALYIADVYREVIEHPASLPPVIKRHLDLTSGRDRGRIYRLFSTDSPPSRPEQLGRLSSAELVPFLAHANAWHRETAQRLLYERGDASVLGLVRQLAQSSNSPLGRLHALSVLAGQNALVPEDIMAGLADAHPRVREHALRLAETFGQASRQNKPGQDTQPGAAADAALAEQRLIEAMRPLAADTDLRVRFQLALSLGEFAHASRLVHLADLACTNGDDPWIQTAISSSLSSDAGPYLDLLASRADIDQLPAARSVLQEVARQIALRGNKAELKQALATLAGLSERAVNTAGTLVLGLSAGAAQRGTSLRELSGGDARLAQLVDAIVQDAQTLALDDAQTPAARADAIRTLSVGEFSTVHAALATLLDQTQPDQVQSAALACLNQYADAAGTQTVLERMNGMTPSLRRQAIEYCFARTDRLTQFLERIQAGDIAAVDLEPVRWQQLKLHAEPAIQKIAAEIAEAAVLPERAAVLEKYRGVLELAADVERGRAKFRKVCAICHRLEEVGFEIGPNLASIRSRGKETIVLNVLDPNREVNPQYLNYVVETTTGRSVTGMLQSETAASITLRRAEDARDTVLRGEIGLMQSSRMSLMPEGIEKDVSEQDLADLIAYLYSLP